MQENLKKNLLSLFIFLLPWQTVYLLREVFVGGEKWHYATIGLYASDLVLIALIILYAKEIFDYMQKNRTGILRYIPAALFIFFLLFSALTTPDVVKGLSAALHIIGACALFVIVKYQKNIHFLLVPFIISMTLVAILAIAQFITQSSCDSSLFGLTAFDPSAGGVSVIENSDGRWLRAYGSFPHPNIAGGFFVITLLFLIVSHVSARGINFLSFRRQATQKNAIARCESHQVVYLLLTGLLFSALLLTFSRSAWLSLTIGIIMIFIWMFCKKIPAKKLFTPLLCFVAITFLFLYTYPQLFSTRADTSIRLETKSLTDRAQYISEAKALIEKHPLVGVGIGNYTHALREEFPGREIWTYQPVHNVFLLILAEIGVIGFALLMTVLFSAINSCNRTGILQYAPAMIFFIVISPFLFLDHWLWTLPSGLYLATIGGAMIFSVHDSVKSF